MVENDVGKEFAFLKVVGGSYASDVCPCGFWQCTLSRDCHQNNEDVFECLFCATDTVVKAEWVTHSGQLRHLPGDQICTAAHRRRIINVAGVQLNQSQVANPTLTEYL